MSVSCCLQENHLDGVNVDFEEAIGKRSISERDGLSLLMWELYKAVKTNIGNNSQVRGGL